MIISKNLVNKKLAEVMDPELNISIVDLGLIYKIRMEKNKVKILMTLTTPGCPLIGIIEEDIKNKLKELGIKEKNIELKLTFDPLWSMEKMSKKARKILGI